MKSILLYIPNIICYIRLFMLVTAWILIDSNWWCLLFYAISIILDGLDGYAARALDQVSVFGAWLDVVVDNISRGMLWTHISPNFWFVSAVEWLTFVCNYKQGGDKWKEFQNPPNFVSKIMEEGLRTPPGWFAVSGLHVLPVWLYIIKYQMLHAFTHPYLLSLQYTVLGILVIGRLLCFSVEAWCIYAHICAILNKDSKDQSYS